MSLRKLIEDLFSDNVDPNEPVYDPVHIGGVVVTTLFAFAVLYWLLWSLLVYQGGLFQKMMPLLSVVFTAKTLQDYGYIGYPYELGIFQGWYVNVSALLLLMMVLWGISYLFQKTPAR